MATGQLTISAVGMESVEIKFRHFAANYRPKLRLALNRVGAVVAAKAVMNLSGLSHTLNPGNPNPFPGVISGTLKRSINHKLIHGGQGVKIGPDMGFAPYARIQELGGYAGRAVLGLAEPTWIPPRPYMKPAWKSTRRVAFGIIQGTMIGLLK